MSWKPLPLHRHLATVGIGPVFVCPPPHSLPVHDDVEGAGLKPNVGDDGATKFDDTTEPSPSQLQQHQHNQFPDQTILTWEIIGDIKSNPQDFIVREIGLAPPSKKCLQNLMEYNDSGSKQKHRWCRRVAGLDCKSTCIPHCLNDDSQLKKDDCSVENQNEAATVEVATGVLDGSNSDHDKQSEDNDKSIQNVPNANKNTLDILPTQMSCDDAETTETKRAKLEESPQNKVEMNTIKSTVESQQELPIAPTSLVSPQPQSSSPLSQNQNSNEKENSVQIKPMDKLRQILFQCTQQLSSAESSFASGIMQQDDADSILEKLGNLQHEANNDIRDVWRQGYSSSTSPHCADGDGHENKVSNDKKESAKHANIDVNAVWIPTAQLFKDASSTSSANNHDNWKLLHKCIREVFPFLRTEIPITCPLMKCNVEKANMEVDSKHPNVEHSNDKDKTCGSNAKNTTKPWVCAVIDRALFPLAPYLANPNVDLLALYKFRNRGPVAATAEELRGGRGDNRGGRGQQRRRNGGRNQRNQKPHATQHQQNNNEESVSSNQEKGIGSMDGLVFLRLQPELPRSERKNIHRILIGGGSGKSRRHEFETFTRSDVPLHDNNCSLNGNGVSVSVDVGESIVDPAKATTTNAIAVHWSRGALLASQKKRKRTEEDSNSKISIKSKASITATFCVLRKEQVEHQVAIQHIARAIRCRPQDVGLAGIKDMQAVTYQFCTLRIDLQRAKHANHALNGKRVELSHFEAVHDYLLNRGDLSGNSFEIVVRNLTRVERMPVMEDGIPSNHSNDGQINMVWKEREIPCHSSHLDGMVQRVRNSGFINFYGEQRVGDAGSSDHVGVRSFDVGRAMLQKNFSRAIDLIMIGRSNLLYSPGDEEIQARKVWTSYQSKDNENSLQDRARATLKVFPKSTTTMVRERDLLKGLVRYDDPLEAIRCVPHNVRMFWIHGYQSYVWNMIASERIRRWGVRPMVGDLYMTDEDGCEDTTRDLLVVDNPDNVDIHQIVLPLPGYNMKYPSNEIGELYEKILKNDGVQLSEKCNIQEATAKGSYRKLIQKANNLSWENVSECSDDSRQPEVDDPVVDAARFCFDLDSGCYATMMLRELMVTTMVRDDKIKE